jgi:hypothetical protein
VKITLEGNINIEKSCGGHGVFYLEPIVIVKWPDEWKGDFGIKEDILKKIHGKKISITIEDEIK